MTDLPFRPNVCMLVVNAEGKLFLGEREGEPGVWQFPQGGVEEGESLETNVLRELTEELGAPRESFGIKARLKATHTYRFSKPPEYALGKWCGQSQTFWLVEFLGSDSEIQLDRHEKEFRSWRWCTADEVRELADPIRMPGYEAPLSEIREHMVASKKIL